jgi:hypothetical protein
MVVFEIKEFFLVEFFELGVVGEEEIVGIGFHEDVGGHGDGMKEEG